VRELAARAAGSGFRYVVALGGDGAFHHLIEGLNGTEAIAGFFPAGNGNDVARSLGIPADPVRAADLFLHSRPRTIDLVRVTFRDHHQALYAGAGGMGLEQKRRILRTPDSRNGPA
jgi:diacylglycerol kinase family enzyme